MRRSISEVVVPIVTGLMIVIMTGVLIYTYAIPRALPLFNIKGTSIAVGSTLLQVEVVSTEEGRRNGHSGRSELASGSALLMVFEKSGFHGIWMKDMKFPIDILWVDEKYTIVDMATNVSPETYPTVFEPKVPARFVIETNAIFSASYNIKIGDHVSIPEDMLLEDLKLK